MYRVSAQGDDEHMIKVMYIIIIIINTVATLVVVVIPNEDEVCTRRQFGFRAILIIILHLGSGTLSHRQKPFG